MSKKSEADLALREKLDLARTLVRFKARSLANRELNVLETEITLGHGAEVAQGKWSQLDLDSVGASFLTRGLASGEGASSDSKS